MLDKLMFCKCCRQMYGDDLMKGDLPQSNDAMDQRYTTSSILDNKIQCNLPRLV